MQEKYEHHSRMISIRTPQSKVMKLRLLCSKLPGTYMIRLGKEFIEQQPFCQVNNLHRKSYDTKNYCD